MSTEVKFHYAGPRLPLLLLPAYVNGQGPFDFILDTGNAAVPFLLSQELAKRLGLKVSETPIPGTFAVGGGQAKVMPAEVRSISLGELSRENVVVGVSEMLDKLGQAIGTKLDGNVGYFFLKEFRLVNAVVADFFGPLSEAAGLPISGVIGHNLLSQFRVTIDYPAAMILFEPLATPYGSGAA